MGRIPRYQRRKLASEYVGAPQKDTTGALEAKTVREGLSPILSAELGKLKKQKDAYVATKANMALMKWGLAFQKEQRAIDEATNDDPTQYPERVMNTGNELANSFAEQIQDDKVRAEFLTAAGTTLRQTMPKAIEYARYKQDQQIALGAKEAVDTVVAQGAFQYTDEQVVNGVQSIYDSVYKSASVLDAETKNKLWEDGLKRYALAHMNGMLEEKPYVLARRISGGEYTDFKITVETESGGTKTVRLPISDKLLKYETLAKGRIAALKTERDLDDAIQTTSAVGTLIEQISQGEADIGAAMSTSEFIDAQLENPDLSKERKKNLEAAKKAIDATVAGIVSKRAASATDNNPKAQDLISRWASLKGKIEEAEGDTRIDTTTEMLELYTDLQDAYEKGYLTTSTRNAIFRNLYRPLFESVQAQKGQRYWLNLGSSADPLGKYYRKITERINRMGLNDTESQGAKFKAFMIFVDKASNAPGGPENLSDEQLNTYMGGALAAVQRRYNAQVDLYQIGDMVPVEGLGNFKCIGYDDFGSPLLDLPPDIETQLNNMRR